MYTSIVIDTFEWPSRSLPFGKTNVSLAVARSNAAPQLRPKAAAKRRL